MRELAKSAVRYTWAMSLFGVQQAANLLALSNFRHPGYKANASLFSVKQAAETQFDDLVFAAYEVGDEVQTVRCDDGDRRAAGEIREVQDVRQRRDDERIQPARRDGLPKVVVTDAKRGGRRV